MKSIGLAILALVTSIGLAAGNLSAYSDEDLQRLKTTGNCVDCDLSGAALIHWKLPGADLSGANLAGANLTDTYLAGANLSRANLSGAILISVSLAGADLLHTKLAGANLLFTNLAGATWTDGSWCERGSSGHCKR